MKALHETRSYLVASNETNSNFDFPTTADIRRALEDAHTDYKKAVHGIVDQLIDFPAGLLSPAEILGYYTTGSPLIVTRLKEIEARVKKFSGQPIARVIGSKHAFLGMISGETITDTKRGQLTNRLLVPIVHGLVWSQDKGVEHPSEPVTEIEVARILTSPDAQFDSPEAEKGPISFQLADYVKDGSVFLGAYDVFRRTPTLPSEFSIAIHSLYVAVTN